jgi:hypothetical protein
MKKAGRSDNTAHVAVGDAAILYLLIAQIFRSAALSLTAGHLPHCRHALLQTAAPRIFTTQSSTLLAHKMATPSSRPIHNWYTGV